LIRLFAREGSVLAIIVQCQAPDPDGFYLFTFGPDRFEGDTWHRTVEDAKHQAIHELGSGASHWQPIPATVADVREFAKARLA
jgi:hypothetical protein